MNVEGAEQCREQGAADVSSAELLLDSSVGKMPGMCLAPKPRMGPGARDVSRRNAGTADPRWRISRPLRYPTFLRTEVRAPFARAATTLNRYDARQRVVLSRCAPGRH